MQAHLSVAGFLLTALVPLAVDSASVAETLAVAAASDSTGEGSVLTGEGGFFPGRGRFIGRGAFFGGSTIFLGGSLYWGPDYYDPYYASPYAYSAPIVAAPPTYYYPDQYDERSDLRRDIDELNGKIDHLQRDVERGGPRPPARQEAVRQSTMLVFKDKHKEEVQNYAVVGGTLWILDEKKASKIPLEDLDLDATTRLNDERGVEFEVPR